MRDRETIDSELRLIALRRQAIREQGGQPSCQQVDDLLDERLGHRVAASHTTVARSHNEVSPAGRRRRRRRRRSVLRSFVPLAVLSLSLLAVLVAFATMSGRHEQQLAAPAEELAPSGVTTNPFVPQAHSPQPPLADRVFIDVLHQDGVPVPNDDYATTHAHAVCDFLAREPNLAEAVGFVQRSTVWDADQSAHFAAGAVVSYCPQYEITSHTVQPSLQNSLPELQAIQRDLQAIEGNLQRIRDGLPGIPGGE